MHLELVTFAVMHHNITSNYHVSRSLKILPVKTWPCVLYLPFLNHTSKNPPGEINWLTINQSKMMISVFTNQRKMRVYLKTWVNFAFYLSHKHHCNWEKCRTDRRIDRQKGNFIELSVGRGSNYSEKNK